MQANVLSVLPQAVEAEQAGATAFELGPTATTIWWATLIVTLVVFVPLAWYLLHRTWRAANQIRRYTERALEAGVGIATNTAALTALEETVGLVGQASAVTGEIGERATTLVETLLARAGSGAGPGASPGTGPGGSPGPGSPGPGSPEPGSPGPEGPGGGSR